MKIAYLPIGEVPTSRTAFEVGAFELELGSRGIVRRYHAAGGAALATVRDIFERHDASDPIAGSVLDASARTIDPRGTTLCWISEVTHSEQRGGQDIRICS